MIVGVIVEYLLTFGFLCILSLLSVISEKNYSSQSVVYVFIVILQATVGRYFIKGKNKIKKACAMGVLYSGILSCMVLGYLFFSGDMEIGQTKEFWINRGMFLFFSVLATVSGACFSKNA